jgi:hypothetical protein
MQPGATSPRRTPSPAHPLTYGYILALDTTPADEIDQLSGAVMAYAAKKGYGFATMFHEWDRRQRPALTELIAEVRRAQAQYVIVPTAKHLGESRILQEANIRRLTRTGRVTVIVVDEDDD